MTRNRSSEAGAKRSGPANASALLRQVKPSGATLPENHIVVNRRRITVQRVEQFTLWDERSAAIYIDRRQQLYVGVIQQDGTVSVRPASYHTALFIFVRSISRRGPISLHLLTAIAIYQPLEDDGKPHVQLELATALVAYVAKLHAAPSEETLSGAQRTVSKLHQSLHSVETLKCATA